MSETTSQITELLIRANNGEGKALDELLPLVYGELRKIASKQLAFESPNHTLQPTALVNEAYLILVKQHSVDWHNRIQFFAIASQAMRRILVNHALAKKAQKRGGDCVTLLALGEIADLPDKQDADLFRLNGALEELAEMDAEQAKIVEMKFFGGLSNEEIARVMRVSVSTVKREWTSAKAWLLANF